MKQKLYRFALRLLGDHDEALDAVQDIFIKLWSLRDKLHTYNSTEAFAMKITKNHCLDRLKRKRTVSIDENSARERYESGSDILRNAEMEDAAGIIKRFIEVLPSQQKMVIQLRDVEGYEFNEIESILGMEINTIRVNLSRARKKVREQFINYNRYGSEENKGFAGKIL